MAGQDGLIKGGRQGCTERKRSCQRSRKKEWEKLQFYFNCKRVKDLGRGNQEVEKMKLNTW